MKVALGVIAVILILALIVGGMYAGRRNEMVRLNEQVKSNWAQVDVVLQRRADLIPNLVATVQGFAAHEETVFDDIAKARTQYMNAQTPADKIAASNLGPRTASPSNASATTTPFRNTTPTSACSRTTSLPDGPASNATMITSRRLRSHAKSRKSNSQPRSRERRVTLADGGT
jgi:hypothetical protein